MTNIIIDDKEYDSADLTELKKSLEDNPEDSSEDNPDDE